MIFSLLNPKDPYFWIFLSAFCCGFWLGRLPLLFSRRRSWMRWTTGGAVHLALGLLLFGAALFFPRGGLFADSPLDAGFFHSFGWLPLFLGTLLAGALGGRFPRAAGIPLAGMAVFLSVFVALALGSFHPLPEGRAMEYRLLRVDDESTVVRLGFDDGREILLTIQGRGILPVVEQITAPEPFFIIPERQLYRISRLQRDAPPGFLPLRVPSDRHLRWGGYLASAAKILPFLEYREDPAVSQELLPGLRYGLYVDEDHGPYMEPLGNQDD